MRGGALVRRGAANPRGVAEREGIAALAALLAQPSPHVALGIGDDAAVLRVPRGNLVWTVDVSVDRVHFDRRWLTLEDVGWRSFQAALSDLGAMGARPWAALSSLILPAGFTRGELSALGRGQAAAARSLACPVVGGNISAGDALSVTITALGVASRPMARSGARPGQQLWVLGEVGLAAAGLLILREGRTALGRTRAGATCLRAWRRPRALVSEGIVALPYATAAIDVSDGLGGDAGQLAAGSGVRAVLEEAALRLVLRPELIAVGEGLALDPLALALSGGEDYALLLAAKPRRAPPGARRIGHLEVGEGAVLLHADGRCSPLAAGFEHGGRAQ
ncbi:MAG: thiamine-phosphate kinase [Polyangiaceae bacterium]|nr:thiamine-phosphate kinase [Polyangiaceae bacterium]